MKEKKKKKSQYIVVQRWMVENLKLKPAKAMALAVIYGFSQDGESWYRGGSSYIAEWLGVTQRSVKDFLTELTNLGIIEMRKEMDGGVERNIYRTVPGVETLVPGEKKPVKNFTSEKISPVKKTAPDPGNFFLETGENFSRKKYIEKTKGNISPSCARGAHGGNDTPESVFEGYAAGDEKLLEALKRFDRYRQSRRGRTWDAQQAEAVCAKLTQLANESKTAKRSEYMIAAINQSIEAGWSVLDHPKGFGMMQGAARKSTTRNVLPDRDDSQPVDMSKSLAAFARISKKCRKAGGADG